MRLAEMAKKLIEPKADETHPEQLSVPDQTSVPTQILPRPEPTYHPVSYQPSGNTNVPQAAIIPVLQILENPANNELIQFTSRIACTLSGQLINGDDALVAKKNADRYEIGIPNEQFAFANVSEEDFNTLRDGILNIPEPVIVKGNGHLPDPH